ncbi:putative GST-like protein yncG [Pseudomonas sp. R2-37-08W]|uniref:glutathione S-transferase N-terminal domain-containing protein n=1 Tax=unclassified Pseudomonas TaxID=196821 RepID=UPI000F56D730|nr:MULTISPECIES: glutathione S-transferase [unclassified Pseudomonas]AZF10148.1 putative GST-like protein yncG [Pseudomonas sp. R2-37-08W]AZF20651.1 putative GST-like protein yncG [Pseudomonas sp. R3-52-08]AZF25980.1 putative GST-like protein yncG [Pseudomonas sp. R2-60-08W]AZF47210.1 putative GST-like protein yncG [Pseudomonas sp. R2-7-07]AZF57760.1 putative GST-like protein yncG [Pseudomonas sp. R11-23-07]
MYTLYGTDESGSCMIEIALQRCGVPWHRVDASSWHEGEGSEALARINPLKQIPTLVTPDGQVLTESAAILIHLGLEFPDANLLAGNRAQILRGLLYIAANCYSAIGIIDYPQRWLGDAGESLQTQLTTGTRRYLHQAWVVFADQFADQLFTPDNVPNALGIMAAAVSRWDEGREVLRSLAPGFAHALERVDADPVVAPVFARHWPQWQVS